MKKILAGSSKRRPISNKSLFFSVLLVLLFYGHVFADYDYNLYYARTGMVSYTGSVSKYDTSGNLVAYSIPDRVDGGGPYRDAMIEIWSTGAFDFSYDSNNFYTNRSAPYSGSVNPNQTPEGFIRVLDGSSRSTSNTGFFHGFNGTNYTEYTLQVTAANLSGSNLWNAGNTPSPPPSDPFANTGGTFLDYQLDITFSGLVGVDDGKGTGAIQSINNPDLVEGTFTGIFQNSTDGLRYFADFTFALDPNGYVYGGTFWGYPKADAVPEPSVLLLLALGLSGILLLKVVNEKRRGRVATHSI